MAFSRQYTQTKDNRQDVIQTLNEQRSDSAQCDVILVLGEEKLPAHKCVLSAYSNYFRSMFSKGNFTESSSTEIKLHSIDSNALRSILDYIYLGTLKLDLDNVYNVLQASDLMLMDDVKKHCSDFFLKVLSSSVATENVLYVRQAASTYTMTDILRRCEGFVLQNLRAVAGTEAWGSLCLETLKNYVKSDWIQNENELLFSMVVIAWVEADESERIQHVDELMSLVRFPLMSVEEILHCVEPHPLMKSPHCQGLVREALVYKLQPLSQCTLQSPRTKPRISRCNEKTLVYCMSGVTHFQCYVPWLDRWFSLQAPCDWPKELENNLGSLHQVRLLSIQGFVYAFMMEKALQEVGKHTVRVILRYNISQNTWKRCQLPSGSTSRFVQAHNILFACSNDRIESYDDATDTWDSMFHFDIIPCDFVVADDDWLLFFNLETGIAQTILNLVNSQRKTTVQTQVMTPSRNKVLNTCKLSNNDVLLTMRTPMGFSRQIFNVKTHLWRAAKFGVLNVPEGCANIPVCMDSYGPQDTWCMGYDIQSDHLYVLGSKSGLSDFSKTSHCTDGVLPFYEVKLNHNEASWKRLSCLPEIFGEKDLQLCICSGHKVLEAECEWTWEDEGTGSILHGVQEGGEINEPLQ